MLGHSGVSRRGDEVGHAGFGGDTAEKSVFTRSAADDKNSHVVKSLGDNVELWTEDARRPVFR